jgi:hypothetical protein
MSDPPLIVCLPWYRRGDYAELRALFSDGEKLAPTFDEWLASAEAVERQAQRHGRPVTRVVLRPRPFAAWCRERHVTPDAQARIDFASEQGRDLYLKR